jgi:hypothetical protein
VTATFRTTLLVLAAVAGALLLAGQAAAKEPCWKTLIDDWYDGRIDNVYPVPCYRAALAHMPEDVAQYSTLGDDINRALQAAIAAQGPSDGGSGGTPTLGVDGETSSPPPANSTFHGGPMVQSDGTLAAGRDPSGGPVGSALDSIGPGSADSVPVPLIVLGALSIVLLTLGAAGFVARRVQTRRAAAGPRADA